MLPLAVGVVEGTETGPIFYEISHERDGRTWVVQQRYSTLHAMVCALKAEKADLPDEDFPPKQWSVVLLWHDPCTPAMPSNELEARRSGLQTYLTALSKLTETWRCDTVTSVLCPSENGPTTAASPAFEPNLRTAPTGTKAVTWIDQQTPAPAMAEAASALLSLSTSPPNQFRGAAAFSGDTATASTIPSTGLSIGDAVTPVTARGARDTAPSPLTPRAPKTKAAGATAAFVPLTEAQSQKAKTSTSISKGAADEALSQEVPGEHILSALMADVDRKNRAASAVVLPVSLQEEGHDDFSREREGASAESVLALSSATEGAENEEHAAALPGEGVKSLLTRGTPKSRSSLLGRAKRSLSSKKMGDKIKTEPAPSSLGVDAPAWSSNSPTTPGGSATPRATSRMSSFRDKARSFKGRLSAGGGGPMSLSSARGKGKGFFSMATSSPEGETAVTEAVAPSEEDDTKREPSVATMLSPASLASPSPHNDASVLKVVMDGFVTVGDVSGSAAVATPPSPGGD